MSLTGWESIVYQGADDARKALVNIYDVKLLRRAIAKLRTMQGQHTKIHYIERRIHELAGCQHRGCKNIATTVHCDFCKLRSCNEHKGPGNHGGFPDSHISR